MDLLSQVQDKAAKAFDREILLDWEQDWVLARLKEVRSGSMTLKEYLYFNIVLDRATNEYFTERDVRNILCKMDLEFYREPYTYNF